MDDLSSYASPPALQAVVRLRGTRARSVIAAAVIALVPAFVVAQPMDAAKRETLRKQADEARARNAKERDEIQKGFASPTSVVPAVGQATAAQVCRAVIATVMGRPVEIVTVTSEAAGVVHLTYVRSSDQTTWSNRCRVAGASVVWATDAGRWRDNPADERITFRTVGNEVVVRQQFSDGSATEKKFSLQAL